MAWTTLKQGESRTRYLVLSGEPPLLVRIGRWPHETDVPRELGSDAGLLRRVLLELIAHGVTDEQLGAFVREVLEPVRVASVGSWKWSDRVIVCRDSLPLEFGGSETENSK